METRDRKNRIVYPMFEGTAKLPKVISGSDVRAIVFLGFPLDHLSTHINGSGTDRAPDVIRELSYKVGRISRNGANLTEIEFYDAGNLSVPVPAFISEEKDNDSETETEYIRKLTELCREKFEDIGFTKNNNTEKKRPLPFILGGNHFITYPVITALMKESNINADDVILISFDAHPDLYDSWEFKRYSHCTVMRRISEDSGIPPENIYLVGIRDMDPEEYDALSESNYRYIFAHDASVRAPAEFFGDRKTFTDRKVYISIDIDVLDPSAAPGTGYPIPGGIGYDILYKYLKFIIGSRADIIGIDLNEYSPRLDTPARITGFLAVKLITDIIGLLWKSIPT